MCAAGYVVIWEYRVPAESAAAFRRAYGPEGAWCRLFTKAKGYLGTELHEDLTDPERFLTMDRWTSQRAYDAFRARHAAAYAALDRECDRLTAQERLVGAFRPVSEG